MLWDAVDNAHGYEWWMTFGDVLPCLKVVAVHLLSKPASASACEFNWSMVGRFESKGRPLRTASTDKLVNVASTYQLQQSIFNQQHTQLPTLDEAIEQLCDGIEKETPCADAAQLEEVFNSDLIEASISDDEVDEVDEVDDGVYQDWKVNDDLANSFQTTFVELGLINK